MKVYVIMQTTYLLNYDSVHAANLGIATRILAIPDDAPLARLGRRFDMLDDMCDK